MSTDLLDSFRIIREYRRCRSSVDCSPPCCLVTLIYKNTMGAVTSSICVSNTTLEPADAIQQGVVILPEGLGSRLTSLSIDIDSVNEIVVEGTYTAISSSNSTDTIGDYTYGDKVLLTQKELDEMHKVNELFFGLQSPLELRITQNKCDDTNSMDNDKQMCTKANDCDNEDDPRSYVDDNSLQSTSCDATGSNNDSERVVYLPDKKKSIVRSIRKTSSNMLRSLGIRKPGKSMTISSHDSWVGSN